jgi:uncharacterized DUF497 family protein
MIFEFDHLKSLANKEKHRIDYNEAQRLWLDPERIIIPARTLDEARYLMIARLSDTHWSLIYTLREESIRIISVRKSRDNEKKIYQR